MSEQIVPPKVIDWLNTHLHEFENKSPTAADTGHQVPTDTKFFSQILISLLTGIRGIDRKKGADLEDGSDVKAALVWDAIDTPRFNGCLKAGTKSESSDKIESLDSQPYLFLVLWDYEEITLNKRVRIWRVNTQEDEVFRKVANNWYKKVESGEIKSWNFQLHPPRNKNSDEIRNTSGNLIYPIIFEAEYIKSENSYKVTKFDLSERDCLEISN